MGPLHAPAQIIARFSFPLMSSKPALYRPPRRVVSGGQTGVDRAALQAARAAAIPIGGWCPFGRRAEDGSIPPEYPLHETATRSYAERTRLNVRDSDGTLILHRGPLTGGTALTAAVAREQGKPLCLLDLEGGAGVERVATWLHRHQISVLNIAGPRESGSPGIAEQAHLFLSRLFQPHD